MATASCLNCHFQLNLGENLTIGTRIICPNCKIASEIINLEPLEIDWVYDSLSKDSNPLSLYDEDWWYFSQNTSMGTT